ncbi:hypothetical protein O3P69_004984 [Scylla paramamosain]|uniref:Uncharacterized protein n=1 Tax=Scylla paramamosain TaxID=85552 RepID=A0AAW0UDE2_SCYPA
MRAFLPLSVLLLLVVGLAMTQQSVGSRPNFSKGSPADFQLHFAGGRPAEWPSTGTLSGIGSGPPPPIYFGPRPRPPRPGFPWG